MILNIDSVMSMFHYGFNPSLITETSKGNYQAVLRFSDYKDSDFILCAHYVLKLMFESDILCDSYDNFMRIAGTKNVKKKYIGTINQDFFVNIAYYNNVCFNSEKQFSDIINSIKNVPLNDQPDIRSEIITRRENAIISK